MTSNPAPVLDSALPRLAHVQEPVAHRLESVLEELRRIIAADFDMLEEVNEHLLLMRGKLFRPTLLLLSSDVGEDSGEEAVTLAACVELVHLATLVHDDAVDHSVLRRGMPTVNSLWTHQVAVILGDYLYSRSVTELASVGSLEAIRVLAVAANEMSVGEMRQLTSYDALDFSEDDYYRLISAKTASLMSAACEMGALAGDPAWREPLSRFGHALGMAFQIVDDLLDYTGSEDVTGKPSGHDLRERKVTLPLVGALRGASDAEREEVREFFTLTEPADSDIDRIIGLVEECGGLDYARDRAAAYGERARSALQRLPGGAAPDALAASVDYVLDRRR